MVRLLELSNATVYRESTRVFSNLNLTLEGGQNTAILGPNGSGKSTLLKLLAVELYPVARPDLVFRVLGRERWDVFELRRRLGLVSHELQHDYHRPILGLDVVLSGYFASIGRHAGQSAGPERVASARQLLDTIGGAELLHKPFSAMSTGEQRRCLLARALVHEPQILLLDEPTAGLDLRASFELLSTLRRLAQDGRTLITVTHHVHEILPEVTHVVLLQGGTVLAQGPKEECLRSDVLSGLYGVPLRTIASGGYYQVVPA